MPRPAPARLVAGTEHADEPRDTKRVRNPEYPVAKPPRFWTFSDLDLQTVRGLTRPRHPDYLGVIVRRSFRVSLALVLAAGSLVFRLPIGDPAMAESGTANSIVSEGNGAAVFIGTGGDRQVTLAWRPSRTYDAATLLYQVQRSDGAMLESKKQSTEFVDKNLQPSTTYRYTLTVFQITEKKAKVNGQWITKSYTKTVGKNSISVLTLPGPVLNLKSTSSGARYEVIPSAACLNDVTLAWDAPQNAASDQITYTVVMGSNVMAQKVSTLSYTVTSVPAFKDNTFTVYAENPTGLGVQTSKITVSALTGDKRPGICLPAPAPKNLRFERSAQWFVDQPTGICFNDVTLTWEAPKNETPGPITYTVMWGTNVLARGLSVLTYKIPSVSLASNADFQIIAENQVGLGTEIAKITVPAIALADREPICSVPGQVQDLRWSVDPKSVAYQALTSTGCLGNYTLRWKAPLNQLNGPVTYTVILEGNTLVKSALGSSFVTDASGYMTYFVPSIPIAMHDSKYFQNFEVIAENKVGAGAAAKLDLDPAGVLRTWATETTPGSCKVG